jgi:hypothetical protein
VTASHVDFLTSTVMVDSTGAPTHAHSGTGAIRAMRQTVHAKRQGDRAVITCDLSQGAATLAVFDLTGRTIVRQIVGTRGELSKRILVNHLPRGVCIARLSSGTTVVIEQF